MRILDAGHVYELEGYDGAGRQRLSFLKREGVGYPFNVGTHGGTNVQEVLRVLIDRSEYLNGQVPCAETEAAIGLLRSALLLYELRAARRHGLALDLHSTQPLMTTACNACGHSVCHHAVEREASS